jgi:hypothetical protein
MDYYLDLIHRMTVCPICFQELRHTNRANRAKKCHHGAGGTHFYFSVDSIADNTPQVRIREEVFFWMIPQDKNFIKLLFNNTELSGLELAKLISKRMKIIGILK